MQVRVVGFAVLAKPRFVSGLAGSWNRVETPDLLAGVHVVSGQKSADGVLSARYAGNHFVFDHNRRDRHRVLLLMVRNLRIP